MSTLTTTTGGTYTPSLPAWYQTLLQYGTGAAATAAQTDPYAGLYHGVAPTSAGQVANTQAVQGIGAYQPQQTQAPQIGAGQIGATDVGSQDIAAGQVGHWDGINPGTVAANTIGASPQVGHWDGVTPQSVSTGTIGAQQVNQFAGGAGPGGLGIGGMDLSAYMDPYTQSVIDQSDKDIQRASTIQQQGNDGRAAMSGAFGGDRAAIVDTETQRNAADTMARTDAGLRSQNFTQAQAAATGDVNRQLQAGTQQAQLGLTADSTNQAAILRAAQGNQQADLSAQTTNQAAGQRADVANQANALDVAKANQAAGMQASLANQQSSLAAQTANQAAGQRSDVANQQAGLTAAQANQASTLRADLANQQAGLTASQANQNASLAADKSNQSATLQAEQGNQFAGLQGENLNLSADNSAATMLNQQQATAQKQDDANYTDALNVNTFPMNSASYLLSQAQKLPTGALTSSASTGVTNAPGPSDLGQLLGAGVSGASILGSLFGNGSGTGSTGSGGGIGSLGGAIGGLGTAIGNGYNWLTGGSSSGTDTFAGAGTSTGAGIASTFGGSDPFSGAGGDASGILGSFANSGGADPASAFSSGASATSGLGDLFSGAGASASSFDPTSFGFARGGIAGYASGGQVDDSFTVFPDDPRRFRWDAGQQGLIEVQPPVPHQPPATRADSDAYDDTYAPLDAGRGQDGAAYQGNLGIAALAAGADVPVPDGPDMTPPAPVAQPAMIAAPPAAAAVSQPAGLSPENPGPPDPSLPVPPIPPAGGPSPLPAPGGAAPAAGIATGLTMQPNPPPAAAPATGQGIAGLTGARDSNVLDGMNQGNNPLWMAMFQAGANMMASKSHTALGAIGEGLAAGAGNLQQQAQAQRQNDTARAQAASLVAYRQGQVQNGAGRVAVSQQRADTGDARLDETQRLNDAKIAKMSTDAQAAMARAQKIPGLTGGQVLDAAARDFMEHNPGVTYADSVGHMKGLDTRQQVAEQGARRLDQADARDAAVQGYRAQEIQLKATAVEDAAVRARQTAAAQMGKQLDYGIELASVRAARAAVGLTPVPLASGTAALRQAAGSPPQPTPGTQGAPAVGAAPVRVSSREQAMSLPPGAMFITPDGVTRQRPLQ